MTNEQRSEIERLAGELHDAEQKMRWLAMANVPNDPEKARASAIRYQTAIAEAQVAHFALKRARDALAPPASQNVG